MDDNDPDYQHFEELGERKVRKLLAERKFNSRRMKKAPDWLFLKNEGKAAEKEHREEERAVTKERREVEAERHRRRWQMIAGIGAIATVLIAVVHLVR